MAFRFGGRTITDSLIMYLDGSKINPSGPHSTWSDISNNGNNLTLFNSPTYTANNLGGYTFDGTNDYGTLPNNPLYTLYSSNLTNQKWTIECVCNITSLSDQCLIGPYNDSIGSGIYVNFSGAQSNKPLMYTDGGNYLYGGESIANVGNRIITYVFDGSSASRKQYIYINGVLISSKTTTNPGDTYPLLYNNFTFCNDGGAGGSRYLSGTIYSFKLYKKALTQSEISQNYNAVRGRFNI